MRNHDLQSGGGFAADLSIIHHDLAKTLNAIASELPNPSINELVEYHQLSSWNFYQAYLLRSMIFGPGHSLTVETRHGFDFSRKTLALLQSIDHSNRIDPAPAA
jgi:hypothetical protein